MRNRQVNEYTKRKLKVISVPDDLAGPWDPFRLIGAFRIEAADSHQERRWDRVSFAPTGTTTVAVPRSTMILLGNNKVLGSDNSILLESWISFQSTF